MGMKAINIYTPATAAPHIYAEDDAQIYRSLIGSSGITLADNKLAATIVNNNTVRLDSGLYSMLGFMLSVTPGSYQDLTIDSGSAGAYRHDLIIADFTRGSLDTADAYVFAVLKGTNATSAEAATDPTLTQSDITTTGTHRQEAVYRVIIAGTEITAIERVAPYIGNVYQ